VILPSKQLGWVNTFAELFCPLLICWVLDMKSWWWGGWYVEQGDTGCEGIFMCSVFYALRYVLSARVSLASLHSTPLVFSLYSQGGKPRLIDQTTPPLSYTQLPRAHSTLQPLLLQKSQPPSSTHQPWFKVPTHFGLSLLDVERMVQVVLMDMKCGGVEEAGGDGNA